MCGGGSPQTVRTDPVADQERIAAQAAVAASADAVQRKRSRRASALSLGSETLGAAPSSSVLGYGKTVLGG